VEAAGRSLFITSYLRGVPVVMYLPACRGHTKSMTSPTEKELKGYIDDLTARIMGAVEPCLAWNLKDSKYDEANNEVKKIIASEVVWDETQKK